LSSDRGAAGAGEPPVGELREVALAGRQEAGPDGVGVRCGVEVTRDRGRRHAAW
jgi:hypothetical protein